MGILEWLGLSGDGSATRAAGAAGETRGSAADTETVRKIAAQLDQLEPARARYIAAFAYLLSRVASANSQICPAETATMEQIVLRKSGLPEEQAVMIVQMAKTQSVLFGGTENFLVTREFNVIATRAQKLVLLEALFAVSAADLSVSSIEETTIRKIASELSLDHADYVNAKREYRDLLATRQPPPPDPNV
jgi:uncharacterized tellurite resistance protein B-like protein